MAKERTKSAKNQVSELPSLNDAIAPDKPSEIEVSVDILKDTAVVTVATSITHRSITCSVPFIEGLTGYARTRIDSRFPRRIAEKLKGIQQGLENENAQLSDGRYVSSPTHTIEYIIDMLK